MQNATEPRAIQLRGVRVHNLKGVDVEVPLRRLTVFTGVSGSGKSSLAFDTLYAEAQRRYLQSFSASTRHFLERIDKPDADRIDNLPPAIAVSQRTAPRSQRSTVGTQTEIAAFLHLLFARVGVIHCLQCGQEVRPDTAADVAAAVERLPAGTRFSVAFPSKPEPGMDPAAWAAWRMEEGFLRVQIGGTVVRLGADPLPDFSGQPEVWVLVDRLEAGSVSRERLTDSAETAFARGQGRLALLLDQGERLFGQRAVCPRCNILYPPLDPRRFNFNDLNEQALAVQVGGKNIAEWSALNVGELAAFVSELELPADRRSAGRLLLEQIGTRLGFLQAVELGYLTLDRSSRSLSGGEAQRVRLTAALGSNLVNALYVLDEPTAGLHPRDTVKLLDVLLRLRDAGNTLVLVEHDADIIHAADHVVDIGPGAGEEGGQVLYQGPPAGLLACAESLTGNYLAGRRTIAVPGRRRALSHGSLRLVHARAHNLKDLTVDIPLGVLCVITGVSGAGKSTLIQDTLYPALCRRKHKKGPAAALDAETDVLGSGQVGDVVLMDQSPLPRSARSNPVTYLKVFDEIRRLFADTTEAKVRNLGPGAFSFNQPGGRCETCAGQGTLEIDMQFLADVTVTCPDCHGTRYKKEVLDVRVRSLNIAEVLNLTVREAFRFFRAQPLIERKLKRLLDVGLEYLRLGQPAATLSGGEAQRLKLAGHLASSRKPRCLFLLDEPTTGLHPADVLGLLDCFDRLLQTGHSVIVVEHDLDVIKCADYVIDLGPGAAAAGGRVVAAGTPEELAGVGESFTGQWLRRLLDTANPG